MAITTGSNIASLQAQRRLRESSDSLSSVFERLSSGLRINKGSDDAAGLSIAVALQSNARVFSQGVRNLNDGISLFNIADNAVESLSSIVSRIKELAQQAGNGGYSYSQRQALDTEAQALADEFFRISRTTKYNGKNLFDGTLGAIALQAGYGIDGSLQSNLGGAVGTGDVAGAGTYTEGVTTDHDIELGDLNGDGYLDMVSTGSYAFHVRLGAANGTFGAQTTYALGSQQGNAVTLGDINNDGVLDIAIAGGGTPRAVIALGRGDGTFGSVTTYIAETSNINDVALADLNKDGKLDLITTGIGGAGSASIRLGNGDGTFAGLTQYSTTTNQTLAVGLADINSDGVLDLVTAGYAGAAGNISIRLGAGDGTFGTNLTYAAETGGTEALALGDVNGDGLIDIVTAGSGSGGRASIRLGNGNGTFGSSVSYVTESSYSKDVKLADLNGDGALDIVSAGVGGSNILLNNSNGTFATADPFSGSEGDGTNLAIGDVNYDGVLDIVKGGSTGSLRTTVFLSATTYGISPLVPFSLLNQGSARQALSQMSHAQNRLAVQRGVIGAFQTRSSHALSNLESTIDNYKNAESRIKDVDIAAETANLLRQQILQQTASAILAQANQQPSLVISLLSQNG